MARILLVEDDTIIQKIMRLRLQKEGHVVILANDGLEGITLAQSEKPDIILMDMLLPQLNGWQAVEQIKTSSDVPVLALTSAATAQEKQMMLQAGCIDYIIKPVNFPGLFAKINALLV